MSDVDFLKLQRLRELLHTLIDAETSGEARQAAAQILEIIHDLLVGGTGRKRIIKCVGEEW
ncbi:MAG: hypothetical protein QXQ02_06350 [Halobacteria archaeon]